MTDAILLDTHILLWLENGDAKLPPRTRGLIDRHWQGGGTVLVSAVTAWEVAMLVERGRIRLDCATQAWFRRCLDRPGFEMVPLSWRVCIQAYELHSLGHRDPGDRLLIATAIERRCALVTQDERIIRYAQLCGREQGLELAH